jgi:hypothetical protein
LVKFWWINEWFNEVWWVGKKMKSKWVGLGLFGLSLIWLGSTEGHGMLAIYLLVVSLLSVAASES